MNAYTAIAAENEILILFRAENFDSETEASACRRGSSLFRVRESEEEVGCRG
jgi:hypothetical protein